MILNDIITAAFDGDQDRINEFNNEIQAALNSDHPANLELNISLHPQGNGTSAVEISLERRIKAPSKVGSFEHDDSYISWDGNNVTPASE